MSRKSAEIKLDAPDLEEAEKTAKKLINRAARIATTAHKGQTRKYTGLDYIMHPAAVADTVSKLTGATAPMVAAAYLHDVLEDTAINTPELLRAELEGAGTPEDLDLVVSYVQQVTNPSTQEEHKGKSRVIRKQMDLAHLVNASTEAKQIKLADRLHNLVDIVTVIHNRPMGGNEFEGISAEYMQKYLRETYALVQAIGDAHPTLASRIKELIMAVSHTGLHKFEGQKKDNPTALAVFGSCWAVTRYSLDCPKCFCRFELKISSVGSVEGKELSCPACGHKATYILSGDDHKHE